MSKAIRKRIKTAKTKRDLERGAFYKTVPLVTEGEIEDARIKDVAIDGLSSEKGQRQIVAVVKRAKEFKDL
jgi:ribosomal protein S18